MASMDAALQQILTAGEIALWQAVPSLVATRYKEASHLRRSVKKLTKYLPLTNKSYGQVYWNPENASMAVVLAPEESEQTHQKWHNTLRAIRGVQSVQTLPGHGVSDQPNWVQIKTADALEWMRKPYQMAGKLTGGPSPMSNALVSALLGAGLGYGGGVVAEQFLPDRYFNKGRLRRNLAMMGAAGGAAAHLPTGLANMALNRRATGSSQPFKSFFGSEAAQSISPEDLNWPNEFDKTTNRKYVQACVKFAEQMFPDTGYNGSRSVPLRPVPVDAFNQAIWNDVHNGARSSQSNVYGTRRHDARPGDPMHTPPVHAAAATGLVSGVQQMYGNPSMLSPKHFVNGLAAAGVDATTARVAGGVLGAMGGLKPEAQQALQRAGVWSGMIRGVTGSVLGLR